MSTTMHIAVAPVVKVSVGPATGNRVARIIYRDGIVPEGVEPELLDSLVERGLIKAITVPSPEETAKAAADAKAEETAKAAADAKKTPATPAK